MTDPLVHTFYRNNIAPQMVAAQAKVFDHFDVPLKQWLDDKQTHAGWMGEVLGNPGDADVSIVADIDAFPLSREGYDFMVRRAREGALVGVAQVANHKDPSHIYAAPSFLAMPATLYAEFGKPDMGRTKIGDVAQVMTYMAEERGVEVEIIPPSLCIQTRWPLSDQGVYGIGTFYGDNAFFHLFESRKASSIDLFCAVAEGTVAGRHDFQRYLDIVDTPKPKKAWWKII